MSKNDWRVKKTTNGSPTSTVSLINVPLSTISLIFPLNTFLALVSTFFVDKIISSGLTVT